MSLKIVVRLFQYLSLLLLLQSNAKLPVTPVQSCNTRIWHTRPSPGSGFDTALPSVGAGVFKQHYTVAHIRTLLSNEHGKADGNGKEKFSKCNNCTLECIDRSTFMFCSKNLNVKRPFLEFSGLQGDNNTSVLSVWLAS